MPAGFNPDRARIEAIIQQQVRSLPQPPLNVTLSWKGYLVAAALGYILYLLVKKKSRG